MSDSNPPKTLAGRILFGVGPIVHEGICTGIQVDGREFIVMGASAGDLQWLWDRIHGGAAPQALSESRTYQAIVARHGDVEDYAHE